MASCLFTCKVYILGGAECAENHAVLHQTFTFQMGPSMLCKVAQGWCRHMMVPSARRGLLQFEVLLRSLALTGYLQGLRSWGGHLGGGDLEVEMLLGRHGHEAAEKNGPL